MAAGPWVTRDLKEAVLAADYDALSEKLSNALCTNYDLRKERDRLTDELAARSCTGPAHICHNLATERSENARLRKEIEQYETVIIPSWKREEEMWREDEANAIEFRRVLAEELDKRDADIARLRAWLRDYQPRPTVQPSPAPEDRLATAIKIIDAWTRYFWALEGPSNVLWDQGVRFLGDDYTGYDRDIADPSVAPEKVRRMRRPADNGESGK
jgi:hypothetical protein